MSTHQDLIPEPHSRTSKKKNKRSSKKGLLYMEDLRSFIQELPTSIPEEDTSTHAEHLHEFNSRTYSRISRGSPGSSHKDLYEIMLRPLTAFH